MKKLVLRVHTQRVLLEGLYHKALMGFKWQTRTKVLHNKLPFFVDSYKVAPNKRAFAFVGKNHHAALAQNLQKPSAGFLLRFPKRHRQLFPQDTLYHLVEVGIHGVDLSAAALLLGLLLPQLLEQDRKSVV